MSCELNIVASLSEQNSDALTLPEKAFFRNSFETHPVEIPIYYKGHKITTKRVDFVVGECMVEIKAKREFDPEDYMQALAYLKASGHKVGLLINFGQKKIEVKRLVN
jgi:GxxExxY protein